MLNWKRLSPDGEIISAINSQFGGIERPGRFLYPDLNDGSDLVLASDYSGEHEGPEFSVLGFLVTTMKSLEEVWEPARLAVREKHLRDARRMSFKKLNEQIRINAFPTFLKAASQLNGLLACVAVDKTLALASRENLPALQYDWAPCPLEKLVEICLFGSGLVNGLRSRDQNLFWITDNDAIVVNEVAKADASLLMRSCLHSYHDEEPQLGLGVASEFTDDGLRAEDLLAIPDLAAGGFSEFLMTMGKENMPTSGSGPSGQTLYLSTKSTLITGFLGERDNPLKMLTCVIRPHNPGLLFSFGNPFVRLPRPGESTEGAVETNEKWRKSLAAELRRIGVDSDDMPKSSGT